MAATYGLERVLKMHFQSRIRGSLSNPRNPRLIPDGHSDSLRAEVKQP